MTNLYIQHIVPRGVLRGMLSQRDFVKLDAWRSLLRPFLAQISFVLQLLAKRILIVATHTVCKVDCV